MDVKAIAAAVAELLKDEFKELHARLDRIESRLHTVEQAVMELKDELKETTETTGYLARDVYLLKNRKAK